MLNKKKISYLVVTAMITGCSGTINPLKTNDKISGYPKNYAHKPETFLTGRDITALDKEYGQFKTNSLSSDYLAKKLKKWQSTANTFLMARELEFARLTHPALYCAVRDNGANAALKTYISSNGPTLGNNNIPLAIFLSTGCGARAIPEGFQVNTYTTSSQQNTSVAMDSDGDFVVTWASIGSSGSDTIL